MPGVGAIAKAAGNASWPAAIHLKKVTSISAMGRDFRAARSGHAVKALNNYLGAAGTSPAERC
jgi:hypothetical protein